VEASESRTGCILRGVFWLALGISSAAGTCRAFPYFLTPLRNQGLTDCQHKQPAEEFSKTIQYFSLLQWGSTPLAPLTALEGLDFIA